MFGFTSRFGNQAARPSAATAALRRIQLFFWVVTVLIIGVFASVNWMSFDHGLFRFTSRAIALERKITCSFVRYHVERYLAENQYQTLYPGKGHTGLVELLDDLVENNPYIKNIRVVSPERYHVAHAGVLPDGILDAEQRDRCCSVFAPEAIDKHPRARLDIDAPVTGDETALALDLAPLHRGDLDDEPIGRFHDPMHMDVYCMEATLYIDSLPVGRVAIHEEIPLSRQFYQEAQATGRNLIYAASGLLLLALTVAITWTTREVSRLEHRIAESDRNASMASLAGGVAHEIRNPLNTIALTCSYLLRKLDSDDPEPRENLELISGEVKRLQTTIDNFLSFARVPRLQLEKTDVEEVIGSTLEVLAAELREHQVTVEREVSGSRPIIADRARLREVLMNLLRNAAQAIAETGRPGTIHVSTRRSRRHQVVIEIADTGVGLSTEARRHMFDPYFTTKATGLGLGLSQVRQDVLAHGGETLVSSERGAGTRIQVFLPTRGPEVRGEDA